MADLAAGHTPDDLEEYEERAGIMTANGIPKRTAEKLAAELVNRKINKRGDSPSPRADRGDGLNPPSQPGAAVRTIEQGSNHNNSAAGAKG